MVESPDSEQINLVLNNSSNLPVDAMVRTVCEAALAGPEFLYEAMLKLTLAIEAVAPTYGLSIWSIGMGGPARLKWAEGLDAEEIAEAERLLSNLTGISSVPEIQAGDLALCLPLAVPSEFREGAAIYARCVRPLSAAQARTLGSIIGVTQLAHAYASTKAQQALESASEPPAMTVSAGLPGMVFSSRAMTNVAISVERIKDSESPVLITGESGTGKELIARAIHRLSKRSDREFIPFN